MVTIRKDYALNSFAQALNGMLHVRSIQVYSQSQTTRKINIEKLQQAQIVIGMIEALILVRVGTGEKSNLMKTVKEEIRKVKGVKEVYGVFGRYDFVVLLQAETTEQVGNLVTDCIRGIEGVVYTETLVIGF
jgi:DNA-binding Lrp family transcriptional regulator